MSALTTRVLERLAMAAPGVYWRRHSRQVRAAGGDGINLVLSFDCDTPEDAAAAAALQPALQARGIPMICAVPGVELRRHAATYRELARAGVVFINHGSLPHAERRGSRYWSVTFYHELPPAEVVADIERGHQDLIEVTGTTPRGFRAPHFGLFQRPDQLSLIYRTLSRLEYRFATTTIPMTGVRQGPLARVNGGSLLEFPVSGAWGSPLIAHDSWAHVESPERPTIRASWGDRLIETARQLQSRRLAALLNYYVDPAHVAGSPAFLATLDELPRAGVRFRGYDDLMTGAAA